jgi:hypothetical protein
MCRTHAEFCLVIRGTVARPKLRQKTENHATVGTAGTRCMPNNKGQLQHRVGTVRCRRAPAARQKESTRVYRQTCNLPHIQDYR